MGHFPATIPTELYPDPATPLAPIEPQFAQSVQRLPCNNEIVQRGSTNTEEEDAPKGRHEDHRRTCGLEYRKDAACRATVYDGLNRCGKTSYIVFQRWASPVEAKNQITCGDASGGKARKGQATDGTNPG